MPFGSYLGGALLASAALSYASPLVVRPGYAEDLVINANTTLNATAPAGSKFAPKFDPSTAFSLSFTNVLNADQTVYAYLMGKDSTGQLAFLNAAGNDFTYPSTTSTTPVEIDQSEIAIALGGQGSTTDVTVPGYLDSARVYFSVGPMKQFVVQTAAGFPGQVQSDVGNPNDPNNAVNWAFMEFTWAQTTGLFADISAVDLVGLPLGIVLSTTDGAAPQQALGLSSTSVQDVCAALQSQAASDSQPWNELCVSLPSSPSSPIRVIGPQHYNPSAFNGPAFSDYFAPYVSSVFSTYTSSPLTFDLRAQGYGVVNCTVSPDSGDLTCPGDDTLTFPPPSDADIFGCSTGPFSIPGDADGTYKSIVPMLCAGFQRGTLLLPPTTDGSTSVLGGPASGAVQPSIPVTEYYTDGGPFNWYSKIAHENEWNGLGYAFPYDDVNSLNGGAVAGTVTTVNVGNLQVIVGGYDLM